MEVILSMVQRDFLTITLLLKEQTRDMIAVMVVILQLNKIKID